MLKNFRPSFLTSLMSLSVLFLASSCSDKDTPYIPLICTPGMIVGELSEGTFKAPSTNAPFSVALSNVVVKCAEEASQEEVTLYVRMLVKRAAPSLENEIYKIPYFVILSKGNTLILKEKLEAEVTFEKSQKRIRPTISSKIKVPAQKGENFDDYTLYVGLQITEGQLDQNYQKRKRPPEIKIIKRPLSVKKTN
ncbi:MAG: hypothetical protein B7Y25_03735 [Alphaproteobacteria bacterium 16-39-46]|nr:MAG: hypothetical protein B7Y25_03735 [Alphaproteobacteria bacterium 16-39-46]OZA43163.1 MAG: hypothetical protein B7X84_03960 [Alphaproteobacteria bacterium 17-39-52]HQS84011.1 hypothetical protein [Alphaproteobacteria bacterium]HQS93891.1 hypothetical protein [Alphaproteobacteria bacterium]